MVRTIEVKNASNLAVLLKEFPTATVTHLVTHVHEDNWRVTLPGSEKGSQLYQPQISRIKVIKLMRDCVDNFQNDNVLLSKLVDFLEKRGGIDSLLTYRSVHEE